MQPFKTLTAIAAPLPLMNVDTDMIIPKQFLRTILRTGLGKSLFNDMRYNEDGSPKADFVLNKAPFDRAEILVAGDNFGCGSSREHAPWALLDFGIRCVIAPSYADIFYNNCFKNGILPVTLPSETVDALMERMTTHPGETITVDLENCVVTSGNIRAEFTLDNFRRHCLLNGLDDIGLTMEKAKSIDSFEEKRHATHPWL
ncbi:3-isopropylmalate dehydratase small subunit [Micavibrio aeruginosavorus]|uniref:3-isopropylmalate dehydratase small subunit n=1 Tax=Micavibrio aeruginosavorus EPB TaxID=349215 RepID=M4VJN3_9BACT|nr:3-isopropylmalate dehydratase small subunit [Micavibrio aeruginosavorus]AGH98271.1 3-isopropylmalate dehydratase small subunit [Micavibrio aeruginosavorus EPB]